MPPCTPCRISSHSPTGSSETTRIVLSRSSFEGKPTIARVSERRAARSRMYQAMQMAGSLSECARATNLATRWRTAILPHNFICRLQQAMPLLAVPPEILGHVASFATTPCLAALCGTSTTLRDVVLPILYSHLDCQSLTGALRLFRACATAKDQRLYVHQYAREVKAISLPTRQASREVKASIAFSLARAISEGCFPHLQCLCWTFSHQRDHSYDSDRNARTFDEPLWRALNERYATL